MHSSVLCTSNIVFFLAIQASDVIGQDVVKMLRDTCKREKINTDVVAVLNDTTGTMLACSFFHENCYIGLIVGTGTNACYMEKLRNIPKLKGIVVPEKGKQSFSFHVSQKHDCSFRRWSPR